MRTSKVSRKRCAAGAASGGPEVPRAFGRNHVCVCKCVFRKCTCCSLAWPFGFQGRFSAVCAHFREGVWPQGPPSPELFAKKCVQY